MKLPLTNLSSVIRSPVGITALTRTNFASHLESVTNFVSDSPNPQFTRSLRLITLCSSNNDFLDTIPHFPPIRRSNPFKNSFTGENGNRQQWSSETRNVITPPIVSSWVSRLSIRDHAFLLLAVMGSATSMAFISFIVAAVSTLCALRRAAISFAKLADTARLELPNTMAAIRLSSMEISDLTLELNDLKQELLEGVTEPGHVVQGSEAGADQIGPVAYRHSLSKRKEKANLPCIFLQPVLPDVGKKNSRGVVRATSSIVNNICQRYPILFEC